MPQTSSHLPDDILYKALPSCTFDDLVHLQLVCRRLHAVVSGCRDAWVSVIVNAPIGVAPKTIPHRPLSSYSTAKLKILAVQAYKRGRRWYHPHEISPSHTFRISPVKEPELHDKFRLLPGGLRLMVLRSWDEDDRNAALDLYDLVKEEHVWHVEFEGSGQAERNLDLEYGPDGVLNVAVSCTTPSSENSIIVFQLNMTLMTHTKFEFHSGIRSFGFYLISINGDRVVSGFARGIYILNWISGEEVIIDAQEPENIRILTCKPVHQTLLYCRLLKGSQSFTFHHFSLSDLNQYCSEGGNREGAKVYTLPKSTPDELVLTHFLNTFVRPNYCIIPPSWETEYLTKVAISAKPPYRPEQPFTLYLLTSTVPQRSPLNPVGPFQVTGLVKVGFPVVIWDGGFWFTRMRTAVAVRFNPSDTDTPHNLFAVRFRGSDFHEGDQVGLAVTGPNVLGMEGTRTVTRGWCNLDQYSGAVAFVEEGKFARFTVLHFD